MREYILDEEVSIVGNLETILKPFPHTNVFLTPPLLHTNFENIVTKGEIAHHEQLLLLPQCFQHY